jgi:hypothetical protein
MGACLSRLVEACSWFECKLTACVSHSHNHTTQKGQVHTCWGKLPTHMALVINTNVSTMGTFSLCDEHAHICQVPAVLVSASCLFTWHLSRQQCQHTWPPAVGLVRPQHCAVCSVLKHKCVACFSSSYQAHHCALHRVCTQPHALSNHPHLAVNYHNHTPSIMHARFST